jgi:hypothetical protein
MNGSAPVRIAALRRVEFLQDSAVPVLIQGCSKGAGSPC